MNFLFLSLLAFTVSAFESPLEKFMGNPELFVSAFANADKDTLKKMILMVDDLNTKAEADKKLALKNEREAKAAWDADVAALKKAVSELATAHSEYLAAIEEVKILQKIADDSGRVHAAAVTKRKAATALYKIAVKHLGDTTRRVAQEKKMLTDAKNLLEGVKSGGRRLLSTADADPTAVNAVIAKIDELLAAGVVEVKDAQKARNSTLAIKVNAEKKEDAAFHALQVAKKNLGVGITKRNQKETVFHAKTATKAAAVVAEKATNEAYHSAHKWAKLEVARVDSETATLLQVRGLLNGLL